MKRYSGDLLAILDNQRNADMPTRDCAYEVQLIDAHDIVPNSKNFYGIREIEELATRIRLSGHITPLEVVASDDEPGKYTLISGERRRAAVLYRLEQGEIDKAVIPCIIREDLGNRGVLTAEEIETINIICANDYRDKTPFEKLDEVQKLKPIARKCWEQESDRPENFRMYFAKSFLGISPSTLQRITILENLVPEARVAFEENLISYTALSELAYKAASEQREYLAGLKTGENAGTVAEVQGKDKPSEADADEEPGTPGAVDDPLDSQQEDVAETLEAGDRPETPVNAPRSLDMAELEVEARQWVKEGLQRLLDEAERKMEEAKAGEDNAGFALWDLRRAAVALAIEAMP